PYQSGRPMSDDPDGALIAELANKTAEHVLEVRSFFLYGRPGRLSQNPAGELIALGGAGTMVLLGRHIAARASSHPGTELARRRKRVCQDPDFSNQLLRRIHTKTIHLG